MRNAKKPTFNADAAEEYFSDLLFYYKKTGDDIFNRDNEGRHSTNFIYSAEYQKYVGMQIAMREVLEYFSKYDLADVQEILGEDYDLDRLREIVEADRDGRCVVLPCRVGETVYQVEDGDIFDMTVESIQIDSDDPTDMSIFTDELTLDPRDFRDNVFRTEREARAALKGKQNEV